MTIRRPRSGPQCRDQPLTVIPISVTFIAESESRPLKDAFARVLRRRGGGGSRSCRDTLQIRAVLGIDRPARDRTARCWLHWCRRGSSRLDPVIPGSAARNRVESKTSRRMAAVGRRKASAPPLFLVPRQCGAGAKVARAAREQACFSSAAERNPWCACRRSASLFEGGRWTGFLKA